VIQPPVAGAEQPPEFGGRLGQVPSQRDTLRRAALLYVPFRRRIAFMGCLSVCAALVGVSGPLLVKVVFDSALYPAGKPRLGTLVGLSVAIVTSVAVAGAIGVWQTYLAQAVGQRMLAELRLRLFVHLQSLPVAFHIESQGGEVQSRLQNDVSALETLVTDTSSTVLGNCVALVFTIVAMFSLDWQFATVSLVTLPIFIRLTRSVGVTRRRLTTRAQDSLGHMSSVVDENLSITGVVASRLFAHNHQAATVYSSHNESYATARAQQRYVDRAFFAGITVFFATAPVLVYLIAGLQRRYGPGPTEGTLIAFVALQARLYLPLGQLLQTTTELSGGLVLFERIFAYLDLPSEVSDSVAGVVIKPGDAKGHLVFQDVRFRYPSAEADGEWVLRGINMDIQPGQWAALVGVSGTGKTTISYLAARVLRATSGSVLLDDHKLQDLATQDVARKVGLVTQDPHIFNASVLDNLLLGRPGASFREIRAAAVLAHIHDRIAALADGYQTVLGARGHKLSGGERQRVAIARVLLADPSVLILDEATSQLDLLTEQSVLEALARARVGRTTLAISHRLSTLRSADVIFVMEAGRIVESGRHNELISSGGRYSRLCKLQYG